MPEIVLEPIIDEPGEYDGIEEEIRELLKLEVYLPLIRILRIPLNLITNSEEDLAKAIEKGRIHFHRGRFDGKLDAKLSKELRAIGATWSKSERCYKMPMGKLPPRIRTSVMTSYLRFADTAKRVEQRLAQVLPEKVAEKFDAEKLFEGFMIKTERKIADRIKGITVSPKITPEERKIIARDYTNNLRLYIKDFTAKETAELRKKMLESGMSGYRYETMIETIQESFGVSARKAKFLARQETNILMSKYQEERYKSAGSAGYIWKCVHGSSLHPVRPMHKSLDGTFQTWNNPPIVNKKGERKHPGEDYGCRCTARPVIRFNE